MRKKQKDVVSLLVEMDTRGDVYSTTHFYRHLSPYLYNYSPRPYNTAGVAKTTVYFWQRRPYTLSKTQKIFMHLQPVSAIHLVTLPRQRLF